MSKRIRLTESDLHRIINESVNRIAKAKRVNEGAENEDDARFIPYLERTRRELYNAYSKWQDAIYTPEGINKVIDAIIDADLIVKDFIDGIKSKLPYEYKAPYKL